MPTYKTFTHTGTIVGSDARTPPGFKRKTYLRKTKKFWIDVSGRRFSQNKFGSGSGLWPLYRLDTTSIKELKKPVKVKIGD